MKGILVFCVCLASIVGLSTQQMLPEELNALESLKNTLNPPYWDDPDPCFWPGVNCDWTNSTVRSLYLMKLPYNGTLPKEIFSLSNLTTLSVTYCGIKGPLPSEIGNLTKLRYLKLTSNNLSGPLPAELYTLTNLVNLYLNNNQFSGSLSSAIQNLQNIRDFNIARNRMTGNIPTEIGTLTKLYYVDLGHNAFSGGIPSSIGNLVTVTYLGLNDNLLTGSIPAEIANMTSLKSLWLSENLLSGTIPPLTQLTLLDQLHLGSNQFSGPFPIHLAQIPSLTVLDAGGNQFNGEIPVEITNSATISILVLDGNNLTGTLLKEFASMPNLRTLSLDNLQLEGPIPEELGTIPTLEYLYIRNTRLTGQLPLSFQNSSLIGLSMAWNNMTDPIPSDLNMTSLEQLELSGNPLQTSLTTQITALQNSFPNIQKLYLSHTQLTGSVPASLSLWPKLTVLDLSYNSLSSDLPVQLGQMEYLEELYLNDNQLNIRNLQLFDNITSLDLCDLHNNNYICGFSSRCVACNILTLPDRSTLDSMDLKKSYINATGNLDISLGQVNLTGSTLQVGNKLNISGNSSLSLGNSRLNANDNVTVSSSNVSVSGSDLNLQNSLIISANSSLIVSDVSTINVVNSFYITTSLINVTDSSILNVAADLIQDGSDLSLHNSSLGVGGGMLVISNSSVSLSGSNLTVNGNLTLAGNLTQRAPCLIYVNGCVDFSKDSGLKIILSTLQNGEYELIFCNCTNGNLPKVYVDSEQTLDSCHVAKFTPQFSSGVVSVLVDIEDICQDVTTSGEQVKTNNDNKPNIGLPIGLAVGGTVLIAAIVGVVLYLKKRRTMPYQQPVGMDSPDRKNVPRRTINLQDSTDMESLN